MFETLKNQVFFQNFRVDTEGYGTFWNEDTDLSAYELWIYDI